MAQFVLKIEKLSHIMGPRASQDLRSPSPIMAPAEAQSCVFLSILIDHLTVASLVTWSLNGNEAGGDLVLILTSLVLSY